jgi:hypothetical protein
MTSKDSESAPERRWLTSTLEEIRESYGTASHATFVPISARCREGQGTEHGVGESVADYEPKKLATFRVCCSWKGSVLVDPVLFTEQVLLAIVFFSCAAPVAYYFNSRHTNVVGDSKMTVEDWVARQEPMMRQFAMIMTGLSAFLLTFYTSLSVGRWWTVRTQGVGGIKAAAVQIEMIVAQFCTQEEQVLEAIRRYGRTSLRLIFLWRRKELDLIEEKLLNPKTLLTAEEIKLMKNWESPAMHETIWAWQMGIVTMLHREGKLPDGNIFKILLEHCHAGRHAVQVAHTHIAQRVPMQYVHIMGFLVKMHNLVLAVITGILFGAAFSGKEWLICCQLLGRNLLLPFLFNAILLMNAELSDPFDGGTGDSFPDIKYCDNITMDCQKIVEASQNMPSWITKRTVPKKEAV